LGLCRYDKDKIQLSIEERTLVMEVLGKLKKKYGLRIGATAGPLAEMAQWWAMEHARREGRESLPGRGHLTGCSGVMTKMAVRADGIMVPCLQMSHVELGKINKDDLKEVWQEHPELKTLRDRRSIPLADFTFCKGCPYIPYCSGNCPAIAYSSLGEMNHPSPDSCLRRFLQEGGN
jgi:SynChlorMet cassette radical SAM/SPASM protein ScmE